MKSLAFIWILRCNLLCIFIYGCKHEDSALDEILAIHYSDSILDFGSNLISLSFTISKTGSGIVSYSITTSQVWIYVNPPTGIVDTETDSINVNITRTFLIEDLINEWIAIKSNYLNYYFLDTINVKIKVHNPIIFSPYLSYGTVTDIEGNVYKTIKIGDQVWMAENLKTTKYRNGDLIGTTTNDISGESSPKYQWAHDDNEITVATWGRLYTWYAVTDSRNVCPVGWHLPSDAEWVTLTTFLGGDTLAGGKLKEIGTTHWIYLNTDATNETGFTALPSGYRYLDGQYINIGLIGFWWSSTEYSATDAYYHYMICYFSTVRRLYDNKQYGYSVRCLKDN
jgi:uncharacterized protein (TIGR02145 family)